MVKTGWKERIARTMSVLKRDISATFAGNVVTVLLSLGTGAIFARALGPANRGVLGLALLVPTIAAKFCSMGQETVNATFAGLYKDERRTLFLQSLIVTFFGTVASAIIICAFFFWLPVKRGQFDLLDPGIIWLMCLITPFLMLSNLLIALVRGVARITTAAVIQVLQKTVFLVLLVIFLLWRDGGLRAAVMLTALNCLVGVALALWGLRDYVTLRPSRFAGWLFKKSLAFGGQINLAAFANFLHYRIDQVILAYMVPIDQLGLYIVTVGLAERLRVLPESISTAFLPRLANELSVRQPQVPRVFRCAMIVSAGSMLLAGILAVPVILVLYGWEYSGTIIPFFLLLPGSAVLGCASVLASDLAAREKPKYNMWVCYITLGTNIVLNLLLIPLMGIAGAAVASSLSYGVEGVLWLIFYRRESGTSFWEMIPRWQDAMYVVTGSVSVIRQVIALFQAKFKALRVISAKGPTDRTMEGQRNE